MDQAYSRKLFIHRDFQGLFGLVYPEKEF